MLFLCKSETLQWCNDNKINCSKYFTNIFASERNSILCPFWLLNSKAEPHLYISSVQFSRSVMSDSLRPHESQHARPPCPSPTPGVHSNSHPSSRWCHPAISSSVIPFSSCLQSLPASESFPVSQLFAWGGQSIGVSALASVLPKNTHIEDCKCCPSLWQMIEGFLKETCHVFSLTYILLFI